MLYPNVDSSRPLFLSDIVHQTVLDHYQIAIDETARKTAQEECDDILHWTPAVEEAERTDDASKHNVMHIVVSRQVVERQHVIEMRRDNEVERNEIVVALARSERISETRYHIAKSKTDDKSVANCVQCKPAC